MLALMPLFCANSTPTCGVIVVTKVLRSGDAEKTAAVSSVVPGIVDSIACEELPSTALGLTCGAAPRRAPMVNAYRFFMMNTSDEIISKLIAVICKFGGLLR